MHTSFQRAGPFPKLLLLSLIWTCFKKPTFTLVFRTNRPFLNYLTFKIYSSPPNALLKNTFNNISYESVSC